MVTHELGHLYFGFGVRSAKAVEQSDLWFALGLGVLFDRQVWNEMRSYPSPLFAGTEDRWLNVYAVNPEINQRLIKPDTTNDAKFGLLRMQTYGHAKAWAFLRDLRKRVGSSEFDASALMLFRFEASATLEYADFREMLDQRNVADLERELSIR